MGKVQIKHQIPAPAGDVWGALADYGGICKFHPSVSSSQILEGSAESGLGAERRCNLSDGSNHILERVTDWQEGQYYTVDIYDGTMPIRTALAKVGVIASSNTTSVAFMEMNYVPKLGFIGRIMDVLMMQRMMNRTGKQLLTGLAEYVTSRPDSKRMLRERK